MKNLLAVMALAGLFASCGNKPNDAATMANDMAAKNEARMQQFYDQVLNAHNPAAADSFLTADVVDHSPSPGHTGNGPEEIKNEFKDLFTMYPDLHVTSKTIVSKGDMILAYINMKGTNSGDMPNMPATNRSFDIDGVDVLKVKDGKAVERWGFFDNMKMMQQLGILDEQGNKVNMAKEPKVEKTSKKPGEEVKVVEPMKATKVPMKRPAKK